MLISQRPTLSEETLADNRSRFTIEPLEPGFKRFRVRPQTASLNQASVKLPTPKGPITLSIRRPSDTKWVAELNVPKGTVAEFHLPTTNLNNVQLSSGKPKKLRETNGQVVIELGTGSHQLSVPAK